MALITDLPETLTDVEPRLLPWEDGRENLHNGGPIHFRGRFPDDVW